jgi:ethanolamine transporter EutH
MSYLSLLWRTEVRAIVAVVVLGVLLAIGVWVQALTRPPGIFTPFEGARLVFLYVLTVGLVIAVIYGALLIAIVPGVALFVVERHEPELALWITGSGVAVALGTHIAMRGVLVRLCSNPAFESGPPAAAAQRER